MPRRRILIATCCFPDRRAAAAAEAADDPVRSDPAARAVTHGVLDVVSFCAGEHVADRLVAQLRGRLAEKVLGIACGRQQAQHGLGEFGIVAAGVFDETLLFVGRNIERPVEEFVDLPVAFVHGDARSLRRLSSR